MSSSSSLPPPPPSSSSLQSEKQVSSAQDFLAGVVSGVGGKVVEYPFDTVKVRLQNHARDAAGRPFTGALDCLRATVRLEGVGGLYKGLLSPLIGACAENAVLFTSFERIKSTIQPDSRVPLTVPQLMLAGAGAGVFSASVLTPVELVKCRLQVQSAASAARYTGPFDCVRQILRESGVRGMFSGLGTTLLRELPGNAAWFGAYELACRAQCAPCQRKEELELWQNMAAGSVAGALYWAVPFPLDTVKSRLQINGGTFAGHARAILRNDGIAGFYRGLPVTALRAMPSNAVIFGLYELTVRWTSPLFVHNVGAGR